MARRHARQIPDLGVVQSTLILQRRGVHQRQEPAETLDHALPLVLFD